MVTKELIASVHHTQRLFESSAYVTQFNRVINLFEQANNQVHPDYGQAAQLITQLQNRIIQYERENHFPFDGNPYLDLMAVSSYIGIGSLEHLKQLFVDNPAEAHKLMGVAQNKLQVFQSATQNLNESLKRLPIYNDAITLYTVPENKVVVRFVLPAQPHATLDKSTSSLDELQKALSLIGKLNKNDSSYEFEVITLSHSSPEVALLAVGITSAIVLNVIFKTLIKRWKELEDIRNIRAKTEKINAETELAEASRDKILAELKIMEDQAAKNNKQLAQKVVGEYGQDIDGANNEVEKGIEKSIKYLDTLVNNGGTVNIYLQPQQLLEKDEETWRQELLENRQMQSALDSSQELLTEGEDH